MAVDLEETRQLLNTTCENLMQRSNVVATGIGYKATSEKKTPELSIICSVTKKLSKADIAPKDLIPKNLDGVATDVVPTGIIRALNHRAKQRPAPGGTSIGHVNITAGTLGCLVKKNGQVYILSNNHVLANSNEAQLGDIILQPGVSDGGLNPDDQIATLSEFIPMTFLGDKLNLSGCRIANGLSSILNCIANLLGSQTRLQAIVHRRRHNLVDAALAKPLQDSDVSPEILGIGTINGIAEGELGMAIQKSGRTTGLTNGEIEQIDVSVNVQYGLGRIARFSDQLMAGAMSQGGDSGSAVLNNNNQMVGLLYAGSDSSTLINRVQNVFSALQVSL